MKLKKRKNRNGTMWYCEWWDADRSHHTKVLGPASGPGALSAKQALRLLSDLSTAISSAREALATDGLSGVSTVTAAANEWFSHHEAGWATNTRSTYRTAIEVHILPALGDIAVSDLRHMHVQAMLADMARTRSAGTVEMSRAIIGSIFRWLGKQEIEVRLVLPDMPRRMKERVRTQILTTEEIDAVMSRRDWIGTAERIMLLCGLRPGEVLALRHCDVVDGVIRVSRGVASGQIGETKTRTSRSIPLPPGLAAEIAAVPGGHDSLLFSRKSGKHYGAAIFKTSGTIQSPRRFRATFATLIECDVAEVQSMLGHTTIAMTVEHYRQALDSSKARAVAELEKKLLKRSA